MIEISYARPSSMCVMQQKMNFSDECLPGMQISAKINRFSHIKCGWRSIEDRRIYFRSDLEYNCALVLQGAKDSGSIKEWTYEPQTFWFESIRRGVRSYKPDFKIIREDGSHFWIECKGYMDPKSKTKLKRFAKYYPGEDLITVQKIHEVSNLFFKSTPLAL